MLPNSNPSIPLFLELAGFISKKEPLDKREGLLYEGLLYDGLLYDGIIYRRLNRHYLRLCRVTGELGQLDFKKVAPDSSKDFSLGGFSQGGFSLEDFVFSGIDFSRYREIDEKDFVLFLPEALTDFCEEFYKKNFGLCRREVQSVIERSYKKKQGQIGLMGKYKMTQENPLILSIMRTLEISIENSPLFTIEEIREEAGKLPDSIGKRIVIPEMDEFYRQLVLSFDNASVVHGDGTVTKLLVSREGELTGVFRPGNKPWTRALIANLTNN